MPHHTTATPAHRCPECTGKTYLWDRRTGERVCPDCTRIAPVSYGLPPTLDLLTFRLPNPDDDC
jgi:hypothetical protein